MKKIILLTFILSIVFLPPKAMAIEIFFEPDDRLPLVYISVAIKSGSVTDPVGRSGLTRFLGKMLLRGSLLRTKEQIGLRLDELGSRLSVKTSSEVLSINGAVLSKNQKPFLNLLLELLSKPKFPLKEIRKLKKETISKIMDSRSRDSSLVRSHFQSFLFQNHPYARRSIGSIADIKKITKTSLTEHYNRIFHAENIVIVCTGDSGVSELKAWATRLDALRPGQGSEIKLKIPRQSSSKRLLIVDKPERSQIWIKGGQVGVDYLDPDYFPLFVGNTAFGGDLTNARLNQEIRVKKGWGYGAYSYFTNGSVPKAWQFVVYPNSENLVKVLKKTLSLIYQLKASGLTSKEFESAKRSLINSAAFRNDTPEKRLENRLYENVLGLPEGFFSQYGEKFREVSLKQVNTALKKYLLPDKLVITAVGPANKIKQALAKTVGIDISNVKVVSFKND